MSGPIFGFITSVLGVVSSVQAQRTTTRRTTTTTARTTTSVRTTATTAPPTTITTPPVTSTSTTSQPAATNGTNAAVFNGNVDSKILVIARDAYGASVASSGLNGYGIPFEILTVPQAGATLPTLNTTAGGNYGGIIVGGEVSYDYGGNFSSALRADQWQLLYDYQVQYGVRMVQFDVCKFTYRMRVWTNAGS